MRRVDYKCAEFLTGSTCSLIDAVVFHRYVDNFDKYTNDEIIEHIKSFENLASVYMDSHIIHALMYICNKTQNIQRFQVFLYLYVQKLEKNTSLMLSNNYILGCMRHGVNKKHVTYEDIFCIRHLRGFKLHPVHVEKLLDCDIYDENTDNHIDEYIKLFAPCQIDWNLFILDKAKNWAAVVAIKYIRGNYNKTKSAKQ